jgi:hypothetical protein
MTAVSAFPAIGLRPIPRKDVGGAGRAQHLPPAAAVDADGDDNRRFAATDGLILVVQDTTEFTLQREHAEAVGITYRVNSGRDRAGRFRMHTVCGLLMHASLAVTLEGFPLGLSAVKSWSRQQQFEGTAALKRKINPTRVPIGRKESIRCWLANMRLKLLLAKARREQFGQASERERRLIDQLELQLSELEETASEAEVAAEIAAAVVERSPRTGMAPANRPAGTCPSTCRASGSSTPCPAPAPNAAARCASSARTSPRPWNACRGAGKSSSMCARRFPAAAARRSASPRRPRTRSPVAAPDRTCLPWFWPPSTASTCR